MSGFSIQKSFLAYLSPGIGPQERQHPRASHLGFIKFALEILAESKGRKMSLENGKEKKRKEREKVPLFALERTRAFVTLNKFDKVQSPGDSNCSFHPRIRRIAGSPYFQICISQGKENPTNSALFASSIESLVSSVAHEREDTRKYFTPLDFLTYDHSHTFLMQMPRFCIHSFEFQYFLICYFLLSSKH